MDQQFKERVQNLIHFNSPQEILSNFSIIFLISLVIILGFNIITFFLKTERSFINLISDILVFSIIIIFLYNYFFEESSGTIFKTSMDYLNNYIQNPSSILYTSLFIIIVYIFLFIGGMTVENKPISIQLIDTSAWIILIISCLVYFFHTVLNIDLMNEMKTFFNKYFNVKLTEIKETPTVDENIEKPEVFNIANNLYTYDEAKEVCIALGVRLATYDEVEDAYNNGAEWCSYGWSEGQMALFPTQKRTWSELQKSEKKKNSCGRPGVNGGFIENKMLRFGINCYGVKPKPSADDIKRMEDKKSSLSPIEEDPILEKKIQFWKEHADKILLLNSFSHDKWSEY